jgi:drug/metabolite transporter (DMT)-like permease
VKASVSQLEAVGLALAAYTFWVLADTSVKVVGGSGLPVYEVVGLIGSAIVVLMLVYATARGQLRVLWPRSPGRQLLRSALDLVNYFGVVIALRHLPLALFYILVFSAPMTTTVLAAVFLKESLDWRRALAVVAGFAGVVIAVNPFGAARAGDLTGYLACAVCVAAFSTNMVWSRVMTQSETPESLTFSSGTAMAVAGLLGVLRHATPVSGRTTLIVLATGLFCVLGSMCFFIALRHAPAATVSQFHYSQLLTGTLLAWLIWHEGLTLAMVAGATLIIAAGLYTAARSYRNDAAVGSML